MAGLNLAQTASVNTPSASFATLYIDNSATPLLKFINPAASVATVVDSNSNVTISGNKTFGQSSLLINNPAGTFAYTIQSAAIAAARTLNLPLTTGSDTLAALGLAQTWTATQTMTSPST